MNWMSVNGVKPPKNRVLLCYCPEWCESGYQVAEWNGKRFVYEEEPNEIFDQHVKEWSIFLEAD